MILGFSRNKKIKLYRIFSLFFLLTLFGSFQISQAQVIYDPEKDSKVNQLEQKLIDLNKKIQSYQNAIYSSRDRQGSLDNEIKLFDNQISSTELAIEAKQTQLEDTQLQINELRNQVQKRYKEIADHKKILSELVVQLNQRDDSSFINLTLSTKNFSDILDEVQYTQNIQSKVYQLVETIKTNKSKLEDQQNKLETQLKKLHALKEQLEITKESLEVQRRQKQDLLSKTKGLESNYRKLLVSSENEEDKILDEINALDASIREKLGNRTLSARKGSLGWPIDGTMTQGYGNTGFTSLGYSFHNGIDLAAPAGQPIYAAADGIVTAADRGEAAYGNWVAIRHGVVTTKGQARDIIALYGHMRSYKVKVGDKVRQGDLIGYEGNTGNTTRLLYGPERGYHLHFTIFDTEGFGISQGKSSNLYGPYTVPYGYTYNPLDFF